MDARRTFRAVSLTVVAVGCVLVATGLGPPPRAASRVTVADEQRLPASAATWVGFDAAVSSPGPSPSPSPPPPPVGGDGLLRAGDTSGGAVTYLKFDVTDQPPAPTARVELTSAGQPLPELVELVAVPDTGWQPGSLSWTTAPVLGPVLASVRPVGDTVSFMVGELVVEPGTYAFAVTVPPDRGHAVFAGTGSPGEPVLRLPRTRSPTPRSSIAAPSAPATRPLPSPEWYPAGCTLGERLVPSCGVLWGVAPGAHTSVPRATALARFEADTGRRQDVYHAYHRARELFPTPEEVAIAAEGRLLFLNWKPLRWSWSEVAAGAADSYLDQLASHIRTTYADPFFFTVHHEPENDVRQWQGSGWQATDYAAMYRHVVQRLRAQGVANLVTVMAYMAYEPWNNRPWFAELYPGDDVVDWIAWDTYAYSDPGYGHGDFGEMMNRRSSRYPDWPGFYTWATEQFPDKPFMLAEWGVWHSGGNPEHMAWFYDSVARQTPLFPRMKALVYFDTPADERRRNSNPTATGAGLAAYRRLGSYPYFQVELADRRTG